MMYFFACIEYCYQYISISCHFCIVLSLHTNL